MHIAFHIHFCCGVSHQDRNLLFIDTIRSRSNVQMFLCPQMQFIDALDGEDLLLTGEVKWRPMVEENAQSILKVATPTYNDTGLWKTSWRNYNTRAANQDVISTHLSSNTPFFSLSLSLSFLPLPILPYGLVNFPRHHSVGESISAHSNIHAHLFTCALRVLRTPFLNI